MSVSSSSRGVCMDDANAIFDKTPNSYRVLTSLIAGGVSGGLAKTFIAPLDRTKIYFQTHPEKNYRLKGALKFLKLTLVNDGVVKLWRGNSATLVRIAPYAAIQFMAHEQYKRALGIDQPLPNRSPGVLNFVAGSLAGLTGQSLTYPLDRARAVLAITHAGDYRNLLHVFGRIIEEEGVAGLFRGFVPSMMGVVVYAGTSFFVYEKCKHLITTRRRLLHKEDRSPTALNRLASGALAGICGQFSSYPLDIVRRRMQTAPQMRVNLLSSATSPSCQPYDYKSIMGTVLHILRTEGVRRGLYKGISMNFVKGPIAVGVSYTSFDYIQLWLRKLLLNTW